MKLHPNAQTDTVVESMDEAERSALDALEYTEEWFRAGVLDREQLAEQYARFESGGTRKTARYRSQTVSAWLARNEPLEKAQADAFLALLAADPDPKLSKNSVSELIASPRVDLDLLDHIAQSDPRILKQHEALIRRTYLTLRLRDGVTDELIQRVIEDRDAAIQTHLIRDSRLSRKHAEALAKRGANPTIRDKSQAWVQDKKFWR